MIPPAMPRLPDLRTADLRGARRLLGHLVEAPDLATLGRELVDGAAKVLPADFMVWNLWTPAMDTLLAIQSNHSHLLQELVRLGAPLNATIHHHPVIAAGRLEQAIQAPQRISDYQSYARFKANPLFREVYRHVDSHFQIAYNIANLDDARILLSWNLRLRDFTGREMQLLHLLGAQVGALARRIEERRKLQAGWDALARGLGAALVDPVPAAAPPALSPGEGRILAGLIRGESRAELAARLGSRRDSLDRRLGQLRERLGFENSAQLLRALAGLGPAAQAADSRRSRENTA